MANRFDVQFERINILLQAHDFATAGTLLKTILKDEPTNARALHALGVVTYRGFGDFRSAVRLIRNALALRNDYDDAYNNLGKIFQECRRVRAAIACYRRTVVLAPHNHMAWINLGTIYNLEKKPEEALSAFMDAIRLAPDNFDAIMGIALALVEMKRYQEALEYLSKAQDLSPEDATVYFRLAFVHKHLDRFSQSKTHLLRALELRPDYAEAYRGLADVLLSLGDADGSVEAARKALTLKPDFKDAYTSLLFALHYPSYSTQKDLYEATVDYCQRFYSSIPRISNHLNDRSPGKRLKIGYISGEFNRHPVGFFFELALAHHDPEIVTTYCYSNGPNTDWLTERLKTYHCTWRNIAVLSDETVVRQIQQDEIDILVDLSGHTGHGSMGVMARKPAPVQVSWIGYYNTSGLDTIDYIIMDSDTLPPALVQWFTERVIYMPESRFCYTPLPDSISVMPLPALRNRHVTFGCFNNISKISGDTIEVWSAILSRIPDAMLVLKWGSFSDVSVVERFRAMFQLNGIGADRIEFRGYSDYGTLLEQYGDIDIALDPFPFSGATTTCEALWMGVPVITLPGPLPAGRQTLALLKVVGLPEFIANSRESYVELALRHAGNLEALSTLRQRIRGMMAMSPLCDGQRFTAELMTAYRVMWQRWCDGNFEESDRKPIEVLPAVPEAAYNRGVACLKDKRCHDAKRFFEQAIAVNPGFPEAYNNLGIVYYHLGELEAAASSFVNATKLRPDFVDALNNLGRVLTALNNKREASRVFSKVLQLDPNHFQAWCNLGELYQKSGRIAKARACFNKSIKLCPDFLEAQNNLALLYLKYDSDRGCQALEKLMSKYSDNVDMHVNMVYAMHYNERYSREDIFRETCKAADMFGNSAFTVSERFSFPRAGMKPLRIGCVSADFHQHPGGVFFQAIARHHDKKQFSIICYDNSGKKDMITDDIARHVDHFRCVAGTTDDELINLVQSDEIDILLDLSGFTAGHRLAVFAMKPALVQASWLGWFNTTGMKAIDYMIVDPLMVHAGEEPFFVEKLVYLPRGRFCYTPPFLCPDIEALPALKNEYVTFGCFNNIAKISDQVVAVWSEILKQVHRSRLVLKSPYFRDYEIRSLFKRRFGIHGISPERIELRPESFHFFMMSEYSDIDIALDPFPYCGGLTSCEALWMGVPVVTLPGELPVSRQTESFLEALELSAFVAERKENYIYIACEWASNIELLAEVRAGLREKMKRSAICDGKQFSVDFGEAIKKMWSDCMG